MKTLLSPFSHNDYEIIEREVPYEDIFRLARYNLRHRKFDGTWTESFWREVLERRSAAAILPYDPVRDCIVLIEQFRVGAMANPQSPWLLEIVAGTFETPEQPEAVAKREALEEANCKILDIYPICEYFVSPGGTNEYLYLYCGRVDASDLGGIYGLAHEQEDIRSFTLPVDEALDLLGQGIIATAPAIISLQWLKLNREWLRQLWLKK